MWHPWPYGIGALRGGLPYLVLCSLPRGTAQEHGPSPQALRAYGARVSCLVRWDGLWLGYFSSIRFSWLQWAPGP